MVGDSTSFNEEINNLFLENNLILTVNSVQSLSLIEKKRYTELIDFLKGKGKLFVNDSDLEDFLNYDQEPEIPLAIEKEKIEIKLEEPAAEIKRSINGKRIPAKENEAEIKFTKNIKQENVSQGSIEDFVKIGRAHV